MTRSQKNKLFGRLSTATQIAQVGWAHRLADHHQEDAGVWVCIKDGFVNSSAGLLSVARYSAEGEEWHLVRIVKPRGRNDIAAVYRSESRKRSAPWEGRGNRE